MAKTQTFTQACSQVGSFSYAKNFTLYVVLTNRDGNTSTNQSLVDYNVYCQSNGSGAISANHTLYFNLGGNVYRNENVYVNVPSPNANIPIASGTMIATHNLDGNLSLDFSASIVATGGYGVSASTSGTFSLEKINRYPEFIKNPSITDRTINSISFDYGNVNISSDLYYSLDNNNWVHITSQTTIINNLAPNTNYTIYIQARNQADNSLATTKIISDTTYDIAKINSLSDFEHGNSINLDISNPANISNLYLEMKIGDTQILSRTVSTGNNTIIFSDTELDNLYKKYGSGSSLTATFNLLGSGYVNSRICIVTLNGNQNTIRINANNSWKRGKVWINVNGTWKRAVKWINVNGTWKRGI